TPSPSNPAAAPAPRAAAPTAVTPAPHAAAPAATTQAPRHMATNEMRASKLIGSAVYDTGDQKIGSVADLIVGRAGKVSDARSGRRLPIQLGTLSTRIGAVVFTPWPGLTRPSTSSCQQRRDPRVEPAGGGEGSAFQYQRTALARRQSRHHRRVRPAGWTAR